MAKGNDDLMEVVNKVIDQVVEDGSYLKAFDEYNAIWAPSERSSGSAVRRLPYRKAAWSAFRFRPVHRFCLP